MTWFFVIAATVVLGAGSAWALTHDNWRERP